MITNPKDQEQKEKVLSWTEHLIDKPDSADFHLFTLVGHHLVIIPCRDKSSQESPEEEKDSMRMLVMDLRDYSLQKAKILDSIHVLYDSDGSYTLTKYKENQVIKVGVDEKSNTSIWRITIKDFKPLSCECEKISLEKGSKFPRLRRHNAQIYQDCLYVYGERYRKSESESELWSFDFNTRKWKEFMTTGEGPGLRLWPNSFIFKENLYVYGGYPEKNQTKAIFVLNLNSMVWSKLEQQKDYMAVRYEPDPSSLIYKDYLFLLGATFEKIYSSEILCCWDIRENSWSTFPIGYLRFSSYEHLIVYQNSLLAFGTWSGGLELATVNLKSIPLLISEKKRIRSMFLNEDESDLKFKIGEQKIPVHKEILIKKSKFFANLFKSDMKESRQKVIEITDCEYLVFKEFIRYLYYEEIQLDDEKFAMKLLRISDYYRQNDLYERCRRFLEDKINLENVYILADFACEMGLQILHSSCLRFLQDNLTVDNVCQTIKYVDQEYDQDDVELGLLREKVVNFLIENYVGITLKNKNFELYENFLIGSLKIETIVRIASFLYKQSYRSIPKFKRDFANLQRVFYEYIQKNYQELQERKITESLSKILVGDFIPFLIEKVDKYEKKVVQNVRGDSREKVVKINTEEKENKSSEEVQGSKKRRESVENFDNKSELKKTKKS